MIVLNANQYISVIALTIRNTMLKWSKTPRRQKNPSNQLVGDASASLDDDSSLKFDVTVSQNANMPQQTTPEIVKEAVVILPISVSSYSGLSIVNMI